MMDNQDKNKWKSLFPPGVNSVNHPASTMKREIYVKPFQETEFQKETKSHLKLATREK